MRSPEFWLTPGQMLVLRFELVFARIPSNDIQIGVTLDPFLRIDPVTRTTVRGLPLSIMTRRCSFAFRVPLDLPRKSLTSLGSFRVMEDRKQRHHEPMVGVDVVSRASYFERFVVPQTFRRMRFVVESIGGKSEPDTIVYHSRINPGRRSMSNRRSHLTTTWQDGMRTLGNSFSIGKRES